ncbi:DUF4064 domain-containing protein [Salinicoccus halitifaciens]|uniref:DUF4064 domain-containing protein n=1 Tax=Salinicoccus halitifaciens TaxID=1073415 RepID=A0ABV2E8M0_9STAP|nr:DUF4064 domain-containing protein [Salinicoccus halitifaciens]MCD2136530.1 DUF4064 domain-containing protein [Salinicoccus halitifaciens]
MARREYTQTVRPVSRIAEKIFGWLAWIGLLIIAGFLLFFSLVTVNDQAFLDEINMIAQEQIEMQNIDGVSAEEMSQMMIGILNSFWMFALYLALPLILGLFGLLTMRRRILAGFLLLLAGLLSAPLVLGVITGLIPLFFIIAAILLFVRKDEVITSDDLEPLDADRGGIRDRSEDPNAGPVRYDRDLDDRGRQSDYARSQEYEREREYETDRSRGRDRDDVRTDRDYRDDNTRDRRSDIEETRQFNKISEGDHYTETRENDRFVDGNIDSESTVEPVTEEEYKRTHGLAVDDDRSRSGRDKDYSYESDATTERRQNVDRRNNDDYR